MFSKKKQTHPIILLVQGSMHPDAHTAILINEAQDVCDIRDTACTIFDLRNTSLDLCDGRPVDQYSKATQETIKHIVDSDIIIFSIPAFAPQTPGTLKNLIELSAPILTGKRAGLICYSETGANYEASLNVIKLLSSHNVEILKPIVRATPLSFRDGKIFDDVVRQLIEELVEAGLTPPI